MRARAIWKGVIRFGAVRVPVKLYAAVRDQSIQFHLLHDTDHVRIKQRLVHPVTGKTVPLPAARKGLELEPGVFAVMTDEELAALEPDASREIRVTRFVDPGAINHQWYVRPYYLGPDGDNEAYFALLDALARAKREGVAEWVMRGRQYLGALRVEGDYLTLITLHYAEEVIVADQLHAPTGRQLSAKERQLAGKLVVALEGEFDSGAYRDEYRDRVRRLIEAKRKGRSALG